MHEMSLVAALHDIVNEAAASADFERVQRLHLSIGTLSCVDADTLRWCVASTATGTRLEGCELVVHREPALAFCHSCQETFEPDTLLSPCPRCGTHYQEIRSGKDIRVTSLEVESSQPAPEKASSIPSTDTFR